MSVSSDKMLELLQQISVLKELDQQYRTGDRSAAETQDSNQRRKKRRQIRDEMKQLAACARQKVPSEG